MQSLRVVDASALLPALIDESPIGIRVRRALAGRTLFAPELIDLEIGTAIRRRYLRGRMSHEQAHMGLLDLRRSTVSRASHAPLLMRCWELRDNVSFYDAAYVALAEMLKAPLVTADARLAAAPGPRCEFELLS